MTSIIQYYFIIAILITAQAGGLASPTYHRCGHHAHKQVANIKIKDEFPDHNFRWLTKKFLLKGE